MTPATMAAIRARTKTKPMTILHRFLFADLSGTEESVPPLGERDGDSNGFPQIMQNLEPAGDSDEHFGQIMVSLLVVDGVRWCR